MDAYADPNGDAHAHRDAYAHAYPDANGDADSRRHAYPNSYADSHRHAYAHAYPDRHAYAYAHLHAHPDPDAYCENRLRLPVGEHDHAVRREFGHPHGERLIHAVRPAADLHVSGASAKRRMAIRHSPLGQHARLLGVLGGDAFLPRPRNPRRVRRHRRLQRRHHHVAGPPHRHANANADPHLHADAYSYADSHADADSYTYGDSYADPNPYANANTYAYPNPHATPHAVWRLQYGGHAHAHDPVRYRRYQG